MGGGIADALNARDFMNVFEQHGKVGDFTAVSHGATVGIDVLAQQIDFLHALVCQVGHFLQDVFKRTGNFFATGIGNHAKTAVFATAFHNGDECRWAFDAGGWQGIEFFNFGEADIDLRAAGFMAFIDQVWQTVQGLGTKNDVNVRGAANDGGAFLAGHATAYANDQIGFFLFKLIGASQVGKNFFLGFFTD